MKTKSRFLTDILLAAQMFNKHLENRKRKPEFGLMVRDGDVMSAASSFGLEASGTPTDCPISRAIVTAAYFPTEAISVMAAAEGAWEHYSSFPGQVLKAQATDLVPVE